MKAGSSLIAPASYLQFSHSRVTVWTGPSRRAGSKPGPAAASCNVSNQEVVFHPEHAFGVGLGDNRSIGDNVFGNSGSSFLAGNGSHTGHDRSAMDAAGRIAHGTQHPA